MREHHEQPGFSIGALDGDSILSRPPFAAVTGGEGSTTPAAVRGKASFKRKDTEVTFTLRAADDASLGDFTVKVMGHPTTGGDASNDLKTMFE